MSCYEQSEVWCSTPYSSTVQLASFPDSPYVAYIVLTFELARTKSMARVSLKVNTIYATRGESGNEATVQLRTW